MTSSSWRSPFLILICGTSVLLIAMGVRMSYGIWLGPASTALGWPLKELSFAMALQALIWGLATPFAGAVADKYGPGRVIAFAGITFSAGLFMMAHATEPHDALFSIGFLTGIAMSASTFPIILSAISRSVADEKKRAVYIGIASSGGSSGQVVMLPIAQGVLDSYDWVTTVLVLAAFTALLVPLAAAVAGRGHAVIEGPKQNLREALREAFGHSGYLLLTAGYFVCGFQTLFIATHFPKMLEQFSVSASMAAWAISLIGLFNIIGCFFWGAMGGRARKKYLLCWLYALRSVAMALFILLPISDVSVGIFAAAMGLLWLGTVPLTGAVVGQIFGMRYMATLFGMAFVSHQLGSFLGIWAGGLLYDLHGNYDVIWWGSIALGLLAALLNYPINDRPVERLAARPAT